MGERLLAVAHRAGNDLAALRAALAAGADLVEADLHRFRGELEVRHWKSAGPALLWDGRVVARRRSVVVPRLTDLLAAAAGDPRLLLDLKGVHPRLAPAVAATLRAHAPGVETTVCTQHWWMLAAFAAQECVRVVPSAGSRAGLGRLRAAVRSGARPFAVCVRRDLLTPAVVAELRGAVGAVWTWPVNLPAHLDDARRLGVTGAIGTDLDLLRRADG